HHGEERRTILAYASGDRAVEFAIGPVADAGGRDVARDELAGKIHGLIETLATHAFGTMDRRAGVDRPIARGMAIHAEHDVVGEVFTALKALGGDLHRDLRWRTYIGQRRTYIGEGAGDDHDQDEDENAEDLKEFHDGGIWWNDRP